MNFPSLKPPPAPWKPPSGTTPTAVGLAAYWLWAMASTEGPPLHVSIVGSLLVVAVAALTREW